METLYNEKQTMRMWWVWLITISIAVFMWWGAYVQLIQGIPFGTKPPNNTFMIILWILFGVLFPLFMYTTDLWIHVNVEEIQLYSTNRIVFNKRIPIASIKKASIKEYNPLVDYGGWGNRGFGKKKAYTMDGNVGVLFELMDDSSILVGTRNPENFLIAVQNAKKELGN